MSYNFSRSSVESHKKSILGFLCNHGAANISTIRRHVGDSITNPETLVRVALLQLIKEQKIELEYFYSDSELLQDIEYIAIQPIDN